ncbi:carbohydrate ABC transporter permease [Pseudonocardia sp. HH130630-07]|uniref:carbohydrate ABC transporter permease n=1 Tax=Pseudonocardia sp. HH130630-07 TaxID=1690815 RepID=UPI000814E664|nr:sugar ABC transporter permease [Pseudonocardia sp. HH130630-07]ANY09079.1 ABC transporter permease [Pseudonocardia sp. HH130630-07]
MRATKRITPWLFVAPALAWVLLFQVWPAINTVRLTFTNTSPLGGTSKWVGTRNLERMLADTQVWEALLNSVVYLLVCLPLLTIVPLLIAVLVEQRLPGIGFFRTAFYTPVIASAVVVGLIWTWLLDDRGIINRLAAATGLIDGPIPFLTDRWLLLFSAISLTVWKGLGFYMIIYLAALGNVGRDLHEAAAIDGAGTARRFWSVTVPGVRGTMMIVAILVSVSALRVFTELFVLTSGTGGPGGQDNSLVMLIQQYARGFTGNLGYAATISLLLFVVTLVPLLVLARVNNKADR